MSITEMDFMVILLSFCVKMTLAGVGYYFVRAILRHLDVIIGFNFKEWFANAPDNAKAMYVSARILAISIFVAWIVS